MKGIVDGELTLPEVLEKLLPKQKEFLYSPDKFVCYTGGEGAGKTIVLCTDAILRGHDEPGGMTLIGRSTIPSLKTTTRKTFLELFPYEWKADYTDTQPTAGGRVVHKNGHEFYFMHLNMDDPDVSAHVRSMNLSRFYIDEGSEVQEKAFWVLNGRIRRKGAKLLGGRVVGNPGGQDWQWRTFFDDKRSPAIKKITKGIIASSTENIYLPPEYISSRLAVYPPDWQERFIHGSFADFSNKIYKDLHREVHQWDCDMEWPVFGGRGHPPDEWPVVVGIDIGGGADGDPWALLFLAVQPETGNLYAFAELEAPGILVRDISDRFFMHVGKHPLDGAAYDWENKVAGLELNAEGVPCAPANKDWRAGIFKVAQYLHPDKRLAGKHPFNSELKQSPRLFFCQCVKHTWREMIGYSWGKDRSGNLTGKPQDRDDHTCDALRYAIHTFRPEPKAMKPMEMWQNPDLDPLSRMFWRDRHLHEQRVARQHVRPSFGYSRMIV